MDHYNKWKPLFQLRTVTFQNFVICSSDFFKYVMYVVQLSELYCVVPIFNNLYEM